jgi:hypothetical protein
MEESGILECFLEKATGMVLGLTKAAKKGASDAEQIELCGNLTVYLDEMELLFYSSSRGASLLPSMPLLHVTAAPEYHGDTHHPLMCAGWVHDQLAAAGWVSLLGRLLKHMIPHAMFDGRHRLAC